MKALRYLLIVAMISLTSVLSATNVAAQNLAQHPKIEMKSTSGMVYSGSTLPSAAADGAVLTGSKIGTYSPADAATRGTRKAKREDANGDGWEDEDDPDTPADPFPLGDAAIPLMLLACAYVLARAFLKRRTRTLKG